MIALCIRSHAVRFRAALVVLFFVGVGPATVNAQIIAEWRFNETNGSVAHDSVGGVNGTLSGGAAFAPGAGPGSGLYSGAVSLSSATNSFVSMGNNFPFLSGDFTVSDWEKTNVANQGEFVVSKHHSGIVAGYFIALNNINDGITTLGSHFYDGYPGVASSTPVDDNAWHMLTATYQAGGTIDYYVDGVFNASNSSTPIVANDAPFMVGGLSVAGTPTGGFNGLISDVRLYGNALTASDVSSLYSSTLASVPEPSPLILLGVSALLGLGLRGWRMISR